MHQPVLLKESIEGLAINPHDCIVDATLGGGGHTAAMIKKGAKVIAFDQDISAIENAQRRFSQHNVLFVHDNFANLAARLHERDIHEIDGILFDLGVSSMQFDTAERGFSFSKAAKLDMRMNPQDPVSAWDLVNTLTESQIFALLVENAQEEESRQVARAIVKHREQKPIDSTLELADIVVQAKKQVSPKIHPATKTFQAFRIEVNQELQHIKTVLPDAISLLKPQGNICVISFHEGEDRLVKNAFKLAQKRGELTIRTKKPITPGLEERKVNVRSRSAKLRIGTKNENTTKQSAKKPTHPLINRNHRH